MPRPPTIAFGPGRPARPWALLAVALLAFGMGVGAGTTAAGVRWTPEGRLAATPLTALPGAPLDAVVPTDVGRVLVGRLGNSHEESRAGLLAALLFGALFLPALRRALVPGRLPARSAWLSPERHAVALRAPPLLRLV